MSDPNAPTLTIVVPAISDDKISNDLRWLTQNLVTGGHVPDQDGGYGLGGEFGYGVHFDNATFEMHPYYWGDCECGHEEIVSAWCESNDHSEACYQSVIRARGFLDYDSPDPRDHMTYADRSAHNNEIVTATCAEMGLDPEYGSYVHCTCDYQARYAQHISANPHDPTCGVVVPNFRHKPSGTTVNWYKYIGRGMDVDLHADWHNLFNEVVASLRTQPTDANLEAGQNGQGER